MRKQFTILFILIFLFAAFPLLTMAYFFEPPPGQTSLNPLHVEVQPTQQYKNDLMRQRLINQYGSSAFYKCYSCLYQDTSDPNTETRCLNYAEYCLGIQQTQKLQQCGDGYIFFNGRCVTIDASCKEQYGKFSYYRGQKDENGKYSCGCINGYEWNTNQSACIEKKVTISQCTSNSWSCENWSSCSSNGSQTRVCSKNSNCEGGTQSPATTQSCTYSSPPLPAVPNSKIDEKNIKATVKVMIWDRLTSNYIGWGTGVIIDAKMTILTNYHVLKDTINNPDRFLPVICPTLATNILPDCSFAGSIFGMFNDDKVAHYNENLDLALLSIAGKLDSKKNITSMWHAKINDFFVFSNNISLSEHGYGMSINTKVGDSVDTIGYPADGGEMISHLKGEVLLFVKNKDGRILKIVTSAKITPGQSGGGAYDKNGKFLGVTSAYYPDVNGNFLAGVIVPVTTVNWWIQEEQGYRINKKGEYTSLDEKMEETIQKALDLLKGTANPYAPSYEVSCKEWYGQHSYYMGKNDNGFPQCGCETGYRWNSDKTTCLIEQNNNIQNSNPPTCQINSTKIDNACVCNEGYIMVGADCISHTDNCKKYYGQNIYGAKGNDNNSNCYCNSGYDWDSNKKNCIKQTSVIEKERNSTGKLDKNLANRLSGYILIQNELNFTPWYLNPKDKKRYLLDSSTDLLKLIQNTAIFADSKLMAAYTKNPAKALGRFIVDVKNGKNYYVKPKDKKLYDVSDYYKIYNLGLGITNTDIRKISVEEIK